MERKNDKDMKQKNRRTTQENDDKKLIVEHFTKPREEGTAGTAGKRNEAKTGREKNNQGGSPVDTNDAKSAQEGIKDDIIANGSKANARAELNIAKESSKNRRAQFDNIRHNVDQSHSERVASRTCVKVEDAQTEKYNDEDFLEWKFETSINEESLKSFLDLSSSSSGRGNPSNVGPTSTVLQVKANSNADSCDTKAPIQDIMHKKSEQSFGKQSFGKVSSVANEGIVKRDSKKTATTTDSYHTAMGSEADTYMVPMAVRYFKSKEARQQRKPGRKMADVESKVIELEVTVSAAAITPKQKGSPIPHGDQFGVQVTPISSGKRPKHTEVDAVVRRGDKDHYEQSSPIEDKNVQLEEISFARGNVTSKKANKVSLQRTSVNKASKHTKIQSRTHSTCTTKVPKDNLEMNDSVPSSHHKKVDHCDKVSRYFEHGGEEIRRSQEIQRFSKGNGEGSSSKMSVTHFSKSRSGENGKIAKPSRERKELSSTMNSVEENGKRLSKNDGKGDSSKGKLKSAGKTRDEKRLVRVPKRSSKSYLVNHPSRERDQVLKDRNMRTNDRYRLIDELRLGPFMFSTRAGICINENALVRIEHDMTRGMHRVVNEIEGEIRRAYREERGRKGWKVVMLGSGK